MMICRNTIIRPILFELSIYYHYVHYHLTPKVEIELTFTINHNVNELCWWSEGKHADSINGLNSS